MPIIEVFVILIVCGVLLWAVNRLIPMDAKVKQIVNILAIVLIVLWLVNLFYPLAGIRNFRIGR